MSTPATSADGVVPRSDWLAVLRETSIGVFSMMVGATLSVPDTDNVPILANVTGIVGIAGEVRGICSVTCSAGAATKIAAQMLGITAEEAGLQKSDAIGEITNIVAGDFKARIGHGATCSLSVPTVIAGGNYRVHSLAAGDRIELPLMYEGEPVWFVLEIRK